MWYIRMSLLLMEVSFNLDSLCLKETLVHGEPVGAEDNERESSFVFVPGPSLRQWQCKMSTLLEKQRERGGVIDLTNKDDVIDLTWVS